MRLLALLDDPRRPEWVGPALRLILAGIYLPIGMGKFLNNDAYVERFERWGFGGAAGELAILTGLTEVGGGLLLLLGVLVRPVAIGLIGAMVVALVTAGRVDGGQNIWLPIVCIVLLCVLIWRGAGRLALAPGLPPALRSRPAA